MNKDELNRDASTEEVSSKESEGFSLFGSLFSTDLLPKEKAFQIIPYFLFLALLGFIYISNRQNSESKIRQLTLWNKEIKELKWKYTGIQADWMLLTKQSQIATSVLSLGLKESVKPPFIIRVEK